MVLRKCSISLLCAAFIAALPPTPALAKSIDATSAQSLPILSVTPSNGTNEVRPDAPIIIQLDTNSPTFARYREQFVKGAFTALVNNDATTATYNPTTSSITIQHPLFTRYSNYTVQLLLKAAANTGGSAVNGEANFSFATGSAIGEATHVSASLDSTITVAGATTNLKITATDDYGDPATNATASLSGRGAGNSVNPSHFNETLTTYITNGEAIIPFQDTTAETVSLSYVVTDTTYQDSNDHHSGNLTETFEPGPTASIQVSGPDTFVAGDSGITYRAVLSDAYGNPVVNGTGVSVSSKNGTITDETTVLNGGISFKYKPSTTSGNDTITVKAADSGYTSRTVIHVRPLPPTLNNAQSIDSSNVSSFNVSGSGSPSDSVLITLSDGVNHTAPVTGTVGQDGHFQVSVDASSLKDGQVTIQATQADNDGNVSDVTSATIQKDMYIPTDVSVNGPVVSWNAVPGATGYIVNVTDSGGNNNGTRTTDTSVNLLRDIGGYTAGDYQVSVGALGVSTVSGQSSLSNSVTVTIAGLACPSNINTNGTVVTWDTVPHATGYGVNVYNSSGSVVNFCVVNIPSFNLAGNGLPSGTYTVGISAIDNTAQYGISPETRSAPIVIAAGETLSTPTDVQVSGVKISWNAVTNASGYVVTIYDMQGNRLQWWSTSGTTAVATLQPGTYQVGVQATAPSTAYVDSPSSVLLPMSVTDLDTPTLQVNGTLLSWNTVPHATQYVVFVYDGNGQYVETIYTTDTSVDLSKRGYPSGTYIAKLIATDQTFTYSSSWNEAVSPAINVESAGTLGVPTNVTVSDTSLSWDPVAGATGYQVNIYDSNGTHSWVNVSNYTADLSWLPPGTYTINVQSTGGGTQLTNSTPSNDLQLTVPSH